MLERLTDESDATDEQLAARAQSGCRQALDAIARRFQTRLLNFLARRCGDRQLAEDLVQETFLKAFRGLPRYDARWRFTTWLFTIARRVELDRRRRRPAAAVLPIGAWPAEDRRRPDDAAAAAECRADLWQLARRVLSDDQFTALWLHYVEDQSLVDVARVLDRSHASAKVIVSRARDVLRRVMGPSPAHGATRRVG